MGTSFLNLSSFLCLVFASQFKSCAVVLCVRALFAGMSLRTRNLKTRQQANLRKTRERAEVLLLQEETVRHTGIRTSDRVIKLKAARQQERDKVLAQLRKQRRETLAEAKKEELTHVSDSKSEQEGEEGTEQTERTPELQ